MRNGIYLLLFTLLAGAVCALASPPRKHHKQKHHTSSTQTSTSAQKVYTPYTAPSAFPTEAFTLGYYNLPQSFTAEPRPIITNVIDETVFPDSLDDPNNLPTGVPASEAVYPRPSASPTKGQKSAAVAAIQSLIAGTNSTASTCSRCMDALAIGQELVRAEPHAGPGIMIDLCKQHKYLSTSSGWTEDEICEKQYAASTLGAQYTSILSYANLSDVDGQAICAAVFGKCTMPPPSTLTKAFIKNWFKGHHKAPQHVKKKTGEPLKGKRKGETLKVAHLSDVHVDVRYLVGSEATCTSGECCRADSFNSARVSTFKDGLNSSTTVNPAGYWGEYTCDPPWSVVISAFEAVTPLNGGKDVDMTLYTGDMTTHDENYHVSHALVNQAEQAVHDQLKRALGSGPVFSSLGNHDASPINSVSQASLPEGHDSFSWNYEYVSKLWGGDGSFTRKEAKEIAKHYGGFSVSPREGLRIISLNTNFWYTSNNWNLINYSKFDPSGILRFLTDELQKAEDAEEAVWIMGHVYTGWSGSNPLRNPTNLLQVIIERYHRTVRNLFFGHSHEDFFNVFYRDNATASDVASNAIAHSFIGPSVTPDHNVNPGVRIYEVNPETYEVMDYHQFYTQLADFDSLQELGHGPVWQHLYSAREAYSNFSASVNQSLYPLEVPLTSSNLWPADEPLTPTFWAQLTTEMSLRPEELITKAFTTYQSRNSSKAVTCTSTTCHEAKVCYLRSASAQQGSLCNQGYMSVQ